MMNCVTIRDGVPCMFMKKKGCSYPAGKCFPTVEACGECTNTEKFGDVSYCIVYKEPAVLWGGYMGCGRTTVKKESVIKKEPKINPLKASKRASRARKAKVK